MLNKTLIYLILVSFISLSLITCDQSKQTKKKITKEQPSQNTENKEKTAEENDSINIELKIARAANYYANNA